MRTRPLRFWLAACAALIVAASGASAGPNPVVITLTGYQDMYNPYTGTVDGGPSTPIICDDYYDHIYLNEQWYAYAYNAGDIAAGVTANGENTLMMRNTGASGAAAQQLYNQAAYLAIRLLNEPVNRVNLSWAIWQLFWGYGHSGASIVPAARQSDVNALLSDAQQHQDQTYSNVTVYSPIATNPVKYCPYSHCSSPPQEMLVVTPEASAMVMLGFNLLVLGAAVLIRRRARAA